MTRMNFIFRFIFLEYAIWEVSQGLPRSPVDEAIRRQIFVLNHFAEADGIVLAGTIVEGGPVVGRPRLILGGKHVHPGLLSLPGGAKIEDCPEFTMGYKCETIVPDECLVVRHLIHKRRICACTVNVC